MITKKSLQNLDKAGYIGRQKRMAKEEYLPELKKRNEAMRLYKAKHVSSKNAA